MQIMFYTIYKITNLLDGKIYIGKHQTKDLNDCYMGSGRYLKRAIAKYGIDNFVKEILFIFDNESEMNAKEAELVTEAFVKEDTNYNLCHGGHGGFGYIRSLDSYHNQVKRGRVAADASIHKIYGVSNISQTEENRKKNSDRIKIAHAEGKIPYDNFKGKTHTEETKDKMRKSKNDGSLNSQFGTMWITNGIENKKIKKDVDIIPKGWYKGRKLAVQTTK